MKHSMIQDYLCKTNQNASIFGNRLTSNHPSFYVIGMKLMKIMLRKRLYLESSMKIKSFFNQWMAALGSDATKQDNCKGSPSVRATSFGFSRKNGTTPSMTSVVTVCCKMNVFLYQNRNHNVITQSKNGTFDDTNLGHQSVQTISKFCTWSSMAS